MAERSSVKVEGGAGSGVSRRDFVRVAGAVGCAVPLIGSGLARALLPRSSKPAAMSASFASGEPLAVAPVPDDLLSGLHWRLLGPFRGGRVDAASGVPGRPNEFYFGHVNGGVWKTIDAGRIWKPIFDDQPVASIGALAVAPSAPDVVYVGSGESTLRDSVGYGNGMYKSTDAGATWSHIGLDDTEHIGRVAIHPNDPNIVFVAAIGHYYAANPERGIFRSTDGGRSWQKVLYENEDVGAIEVVIDPSNPQVVYAGLWNTRRPPWFTYAPTNGPGGGIYKSADGGDTWQQLTEGLPPEGIGRTGIAVAPSNPNRVYALVDCLLAEPGTDEPQVTGGFGAGATGQGGFFRSDDAGATWRRLSADSALWGRGWYFEHVVVDPEDADIVYVPNVSVSRSFDGGMSWEALRGSPGGDDYHEAWISPDDPNTMIVSSDQGCIITRNARAADARDVTWSSWYNQPTAQIYHVSVDPRFPYWVTGAQQDSGAVAVRSRGKFAEISMRDWEPIGAGGESGVTAGDPLHPGIIYGGTGTRYDLEHNLRLPDTASPQNPEGEDARTDWTQPLVLSKADPHVLFYANQFLFKSTDVAESWQRISPDLTRPNPGIPAGLDEAAANDTGNDRRGVIYTIAPSPLDVDLIWVGTDDGWIHVSADGGANWRNVTPPAVTAWSRITTVEASHFDRDTAWASVDRHQLQDFDPYIYRTRDGGASWQAITEGLPAGVYAHVVKEDPMRRGLLFAGTERGVFVSFDDGDHWQALQLDLPVTSMRDFEVYGNDLIVATHGRGFWVIDDISPLRQLTDDIATEDVHLFKPADVVDYQQGGDNGTPVQKGEPQAENPPEGAFIYYWLRSDASGPVRLEILDEQGQVRQTFGSEASAQGRGGRGRGGGRGIPNTSPLWRPDPVPFATGAGMHRVVWNSHGGGGRGFGGGRGRGGPAPSATGTFTARLTVNGRSYSETFTIQADPRTR